MAPLIFALPGNEDLSASLADAINADAGEIEIRRFPDGESYVRVLSDVKDREVICACTLHRPDDKLLPLYFLARLLNELGATRVGLVAPYLAYMRQDRRFHSGEAVTSKLFAGLISDYFDWMVTVDPHLHRLSNLNAIYTIPAVSIHAAPLISDWIKANIDRPILIGPDGESEQWVSQVAQQAGAPFTVLQKLRHGDSDVEVSMPDVDEYRDRTPVLVDDIISTAHTMMETVAHLKALGLAAPVCIGVHAVFAGTAYADLRASGAGRIVTCNTIPHETNRVDVVPIVAEQVRERLGD
jgi:ribose-phosphate pyrophosphokinase